MNEIEKAPSFIKNYLELEDSIDINQAEALNVLFSKVNSNEITSSNVIYENMIEDGIKLLPKNKTKQDKLDEKSTKELLSFIDNEIDKNKNDSRKMSFYKAFTTLIKNSNYINTSEEIVLNFLFDKIKYFDKEIVYDNSDKFAVRRKKREIENKGLQSDINDSCSAGCVISQ